MDKDEAIKKLNEYSEIVRKNFSVKKIVLFGSHAKGGAREESDLDVAVVGDSIGSDILGSEQKLYRLRRDIDTRIEPVIIEEDNDRGGFLEEILRTGIVIYSA